MVILIFNRTKNTGLNMLLNNIEEGKAGIDDLDRAGFTALYSAVKLKDLELVKQLIKAGADVNKASGDMLHTPLIVAVMFCDMSSGIIQLLLSNGADPNIKNSIMSSAVDIARNLGYDGEVELFLKYKRVESVEDTGW